MRPLRNASSARPPVRSNNRLAVVLDAAAQLFSKNGFKETTTRDISAIANLNAGSLYYHFKSKDELLLAVYEEGVRRVTEHVLAAVAGVTDPWLRLEAILRGHLESILEQSPYASVIVRVLPQSVPAVQKQLIRLRDSYESIYIEAIEALPLAPWVDRRLLRLFLLGATNYSQVWFRDGEYDPAALARELVRVVKEPAARPRLGGSAR